MLTYRKVRDFPRKRTVASGGLGGQTTEVHYQSVRLNKVSCPQHTLSELTVRAQTKKLMGDPCPHQLSLQLREPRSTSKPRRALIGASERPGIVPLDQRMSTADVLRIVGVKWLNAVSLDEEGPISAKARLGRLASIRHRAIWNNGSERSAKP